jgi:hypothetical protein
VDKILRIIHLFFPHPAFTAGILLAITFLWKVCYAVLAFLRPFPLEELIIIGDIYQLVLGFGAMAILFARMTFPFQKTKKAEE